MSRAKWPVRIRSTTAARHLDRGVRACSLGAHRTPSRGLARMVRAGARGVRGARGGAGWFRVVAWWLQWRGGPESCLLVHDEQENGHHEVHRLTVADLGVVACVCTRGANAAGRCGSFEACGPGRAGWGRVAHAVSTLRSEASASC